LRYCASLVYPVVATPHYNYKYTVEKSKILAEAKRLNNIAKESNLNVNILPGQVIRAYGELINDYEAAKLLTIADNSNICLSNFQLAKGHPDMTQEQKASLFDWCN